MRLASRPMLIAATLVAGAAPVPALAQDSEAAAAEMAERLSDPVEQERMAATLATVSEVLLSMPIAPIAEAIENATGDEIPEVHPDTTLRSLAGPKADRVAPEIERNVPRVMGAMASMAESFETMMPALRDMAERLRRALPERAD